MDLQSRLDIYLKKKPKLDPTTFIANGAIIIGDVELKSDVSIWYNATLRADINSIKINSSSNIQDNCVIHLSDDYGVKIGSYVTIGHSSVIHGCEIDDECLIGINSTILDGVKIGKNSIIGANSLLIKDMIIPEGSLVLGTPAKIIRELTKKEKKSIRLWAEKYVKIKNFYKRFCNK